MQKVIRIGTRRSRLALAQTYLVKEKIERAFPDIQAEILEISTKGDELLDRSLTSFGGKGVFTRELEEALLSGRIDLAVHSAKDMPMEFPEGLGIGAALSRAAVEDVAVTRDGTALRDLKPGSVVGTSSLRRELQIKAINPLVKIKMIRGNVQTRLRKLSEEQYDAIVLAAAGLQRLELSGGNEYCFEYLDTAVCLPAAGQAILAVESRNGHLTEVLEKIHDPEAAVSLMAERAYLSAIGGSCNAPAAALSRLEGNTLSMEVLFAPDGRHLKRAAGSKVTGLDTEMAEELGRELAASGAVVVTGLARGVDSAAARGALRAGGSVVGVTGGGLDVVYPPENGDLYADVAARGVLLSEYPPGSPPDKAHFPVRNRIMSGLSVAALVVEAPGRSGALITARLALETNCF